MPRGVPKGGGKRQMVVRLPGAPTKKRGAHQDQEEGRVDTSIDAHVRPFPSRTWGPILPAYDGPYYGAVKVYDAQGVLLREIPVKALDRRGKIQVRPIPMGEPTKAWAKATWDWRMPAEAEIKRQRKRKYGYPGTGATPWTPLS